MSIFRIIGICFIICCFILLILIIPYMLSNEQYNEDSLYWKIAIPIVAVLFIGSIFIGIGINTENEKIYVKKYLAQKETIEMSLESEELSGLERIELVKKATGLNGELAEKKAMFELWHFVTYDNTIYDNVEFIDFNKKGDQENV